jgi:hypothetical protein
MDITTVAIALLHIIFTSLQFDMIELLKDTEILQWRKVVKIDE